MRPVTRMVPGYPGMHLINPSEAVAAAATCRLATPSYAYDDETTTMRGSIGRPLRPSRLAGRPRAPPARHRARERRA
eukprot:361863-Rhodomonas_salina.1